MNTILIFIVIIVSLVLIATICCATFYHKGCCNGREEILGKIHKVSDVYMQKETGRSERQIHQDKIMQLLNEISTLDAMQEKELGNGKIEVSMYIYKLGK